MDNTIGGHEVLKKSFFSVVIPVYNRKELLQKAIRSVLSQTFTDYELIIADDCSTQDIEGLTIALNSPKIRYFRNPENKGNAGARNLGARNATGKYICYLDSDDQYHPNFLEKMSALIHSSKFPGFLWCGVNYFDANGSKTSQILPPDWNPMQAKDPYLFFLKGIYFGTSCGFTIRRDCMNKMGGFNETIRTSVDTEFILRLVQHFNFNFTQEILLDHFDHKGVRVRNDTSEKLKAYTLLLKDHNKIINNHPNLKRRWNHKLMWLNYHNGKKKEARKYFWVAFKTGNYKSVLYACLFEVFQRGFALMIHQKVSKFL